LKSRARRDANEFRCIHSQASPSTNDSVCERGPEEGFPAFRSFLLQAFIVYLHDQVTNGSSKHLDGMFLDMHVSVIECLQVHPVHGCSAN
jgi:hypothetical protein